MATVDLEGFRGDDIPIEFPVTQGTEPMDLSNIQAFTVQFWRWPNDPPVATLTLVNNGVVVVDAPNGLAVATLTGAMQDGLPPCVLAYTAELVESNGDVTTVGDGKLTLKRDRSQ